MFLKIITHGPQKNLALLPVIWVSRNVCNKGAFEIKVIVVDHHWRKKNISVVALVSLCKGKNASIPFESIYSVWNLDFSILNFAKLPFCDRKQSSIHSIITCQQSSNAAELEYASDRNVILLRDSRIIDKYWEDCSASLRVNRDHRKTWSLEGKNYLLDWKYNDRRPQQVSSSLSTSVSIFPVWIFPFTTKNRDFVKVSLSFRILRFPCLLV